MKKFIFRIKHVSDLLGGFDLIQNFAFNFFNLEAQAGYAVVPDFSGLHFDLDSDAGVARPGLASLFTDLPLDSLR